MSEPMPEYFSRAQQRSVLEAFSRSLMRESHALCERPDLLFQQMYNRLQSAPPPAGDIVNQRAERSTTARQHKGPWMRLRSSITESQALERSLNIGSRVRACSVSPDDASVIAIGSRGLTAHDIESGRELQRFGEEAGSIELGDISRDGAHLVTIDSSGTLQTWDVEESRAVMAVKVSKGFRKLLAFSPDDTLLLVGSLIKSLTSDDGYVSVWDVQARQEATGFRAHNLDISAGAFSPDGTLIATGGTDYSPDDSPARLRWTVKLWDVRSGALRATLEGHTSSVYSCVFSPDGTHIMSLGGSDELRLWHVPSQQQIPMLPIAGTLREAAFRPDGNLWVMTESSTGESEPILALWDVDVARGSAQLNQRFEGLSSEKLDICQISPDGEYMLLGASSQHTVFQDQDSLLVIWDIGAAQVRARFDRPIGNSAKKFKCAISPSGSRIAYANDTCQVSIWDSRNGDMAAALRDHVCQSKACAVSANGSLTALVGSDRTIRVWSIPDGTLLATLPWLNNQHNDKEIDPWRDVPTSCTFNAASELLAVAGDLGDIRIWDTRTWKEIPRFSAYPVGIWLCAFSPNGSFLVTACDDHTLIVWDVSSGRKVATMVGHQQAVTDLAISQDGDWVVSTSKDGTLRRWQLLTGEQAGVYWGHLGDLTACAISSDGRIAISGGDNDYLMIWGEPNEGASPAVTPRANRFAGCSFASDGSYIVAAREGDDGGGILLLDPESAQVRSQLATSHLRAFEVSKAGNLIVSTGYGTWTLWDARKEEPLWNYNSDHSDFGDDASATLSPDGKYVAYAEGLALLRWDTRSKRTHTSPTGHTDRINACMISPDGRMILTGSNDETLKLWDARSARELATLHEYRKYGEVHAFSPSGRTIVYQRWGDAVMLWDVPSNKLRQRLELSDRIRRLALSPDDRHMVTVAGGDITVWQMATGTEYAHIDAWAWDCTVSPDGSYLIYADMDHRLCVWDIDAHRERAIIVLPDTLYRVAVHPWLPRIAGLGKGGTVYLMDVIGLPYQPIVVTASQQGRELTVQCPVCFHAIKIGRHDLGGTKKCARPGCVGHMRINPFVLKMASKHTPAFVRGWWPFSQPR